MLVVLVLLAAGGGRVSGCHSRSGEDAERVGVGGHVSPRVSHVSRVQVYSHQGTEPTFEKEEAAAVARGSEDAAAGGEQLEHVREEGEMKVTLGSMSHCTVKHHTDIINFACMMWNFVRILDSLSALCTNIY